MSNEKRKIAIPSGGGTVQNYLDALIRLGAEPVIVDGSCQVERYDGLLLPGGGDVNPARFGQNNCQSEEIDDVLDALQLGVLDRFVEAQRPVLGICRGHQVINVYFGGDLIQDLGSEKNARHRRCAGGDRVHRTTAVEDSWLAKLYGTEIVTNSAHHQGLGKIGRGLSVIQWSKDGVAEGMVHEMLPVISVQWHPERMCFAHEREDTVDGSRVLQYFLQLCRF